MRAITRRAATLRHQVLIATRMRSSLRQDTTPSPQASPRLLGVLRQHNFRSLWFAFISASLLQRMDGVVLGWLVLELTDSPFLVGLIGSLRFVGALLGPVTGVLADRYDRRRVLISSLLAMTSVLALLLGLIVFRRLEVWHLFVVTTIWGILWAVHQPAQQSMQADVLSGGELVSGIALMTTAMNVTSVIGPALGGALLACCGPEGQVWEWTEEAMALAVTPDSYTPGRVYAALESGQVAMSRDQGMTWVPTALALPEAVVRSLATAGAAQGVQWSYVVLCGLHLLQLWNYLALRLERRAPSGTRTSLVHNLLAGMRYSCSNPGLWTALALAGLVNLVAFPLQFGLLPVFAREVFSVGAAGLGLLGSAIGIGSLLGSLLMAFVGTLARAGRLMFLGTMGWFVFLLAFAMTPNYTVALVMLVLMGVAQTFSLANMTVILLGTSSSEMRGRIMGLRSLAVAPLFLGGTLAGAATSSLGVALTTGICAVLGLLMTLWVAPWIPRHVGAPEGRTA